jgi:hypothetical protein
VLDRGKVVHFSTSAELRAETDTSVLLWKTPQPVLNPGPKLSEGDLNL